MTAEEAAEEAARFLDELVNQYGLSLAVAVPMASQYALGLGIRHVTVTIRQHRQREPWERDAD